MNSPEKTAVSLSLIIPVYNERVLLANATEHCLDELQKYFSNFELILVDDGSTDGSGELLKQTAKKDPRIMVIENGINLNVGISIQRAIKAATKDFVVHNGIDLPLAIADIAKQLPEMTTTDVLIFERSYYSGATSWRKITSFLNRTLLMLLFPRTFSRVRDFNFSQIYRRSILEQILPKAKSPAFTTPEMIIRAQVLGLAIRTVRTEYQQRSIGQGAFGKFHDILWSLSDMIRFRLAFYPSLRLSKLQCKQQEYGTPKS